MKERNVGFDLVPALLSGKVDAVLGAYWNYEAIQLREKGRAPQVIRIEQAGVPTYDELVIAARRERRARPPRPDPQVPRRARRGHARARGRPGRRDP